jgi:hypothetical protein
VRRAGPVDAALRRARVCYDHLAGEAGVRLFDRLRERGFLHGPDVAPSLTGSGETWCRSIGVDLTALARGRRTLCRGCLDWSERRMHLAGGLGAALLERMLGVGHLRRAGTGRTLVVSAKGEAFIERLWPLR